MRNNLVFIVFDSCRYDNFIKAATPRIDRLGGAERRYSFCSWTFPAHAVYLMGMSPHDSPKGVFASTVYKQDFVKWSTRLNIPDISFEAFVPYLSLPYFLKQQGYRTAAHVSLPVLNQTTILNQHFDRWELMDQHNDFNAIIDRLTFDSEQPSFYFLNIGETHYPYSLPGERPEDLPVLHGVHGVFKHMGDAPDERPEAEFFNLDTLEELCAKQRSNVEYLDRLFDKLFDVCPPNTYYIVTSDHGELFGEENYFGHGPIFHEKVFEVFWTEGRL